MSKTLEELDKVVEDLSNVIIKSDLTKRESLIVCFILSDFINVLVHKDFINEKS